MSSRTSKATTAASRYSPSRRSTRGSFIPATTCAFVTTRFGAAAQPEPETPRPQALPVTRKTLLRAERTAGLASSAGSGGATFASGPRIVRNGSTRAIASSRRDGGTRSLISPRIRERCTSSRSSRWPGRWSATAPITQTIATPATAPSTRPPSESSHRSGGSTNRLVRIALPAIDAMLWKRITSTAAPPSATSGVYGDSRPERNSGASLAPMYAPTTIPASPSSPPMSPRLSPIRAEIAITPAAIQSMLVTGASRTERRRGRARTAAGSPPGDRRCSARTP